MLIASHTSVFKTFTKETTEKGNLTCAITAIDTLNGVTYPSASTLKSFLLDNVYLVSLAVIGVVFAIAFYSFKCAHRLAQQSQAKSQLAGFGPQFVLVVLVSFWLNNLYGDARERDNRKWDIRHNHHIRLQPLLRDDAEVFLEFANRATKGARVAGFNGTALENVALLFKAEVLRADLANHYPPYWTEREKLLKMWNDMMPHSVRRPCGCP